MRETKQQMWKRGLLPGLLLALSVPSLASAQCATDEDCGEGQRCDEPVMLVECAQEDCPDPSAAGGTCVSELLGQACQIDEDCGPDLMCLGLLTAECPDSDPECGADEMVEGFCDVEGSVGVLAATSGLAPEGAAGPEAQSGVADSSDQGAPPPTSGASPQSSGGCSVGGGAAGASSLAWLSVAALLLRRRRR